MEDKIKEIEIETIMKVHKVQNQIKNKFHLKILKINQTILF